MKIGIVGGGAAGSYLAIRIKELHPDFLVTIIDKNDRLLKKVNVTGNGRCNYANLGKIDHKYYNEPFAKKILKNLPPQKLIENFASYGIYPTTIDHLVYPLTLSAQTVVLLLTQKIKELRIEVLLNEVVEDYCFKNNRYILKTNQQELIFDRLVFAFGGKAYPQLGTDGALFDILSKHQYHLASFSPSLCPIKVKENTKKVSGQRARCRVSLFGNNVLNHQEDGEVLFKDDGLSGIVILNMSQKINALNNKKDIKLVLDLAVNQGVITEDKYIQFVSPKIADYLISNHLDIHYLTYSFKAFYDYQVAEVSHGGLLIKCVNDSLESKRESGLYFIGEVLDVDGACGGYNLMFAFASAETVAKAIKE